MQEGSHSGSDNEDIDVNEGLGIQAVRLNQATGKFEDAGELTIAKMMEGMSMWANQLLVDQLAVLVQRRVITQEQAARAAADKDIERYVFLEGNNHSPHFYSYAVKALLESVFTMEDLFGMEKLRLDYLTARRETTKGDGGIGGLGRTFDGLGIILLREGICTMAQFKQLPLCHMEALFNGLNGEGLYALQKKLITFDEIMAFAEEPYVHEGHKGKLAEEVSRRLTQHYDQVYKPGRTV